MNRILLATLAAGALSACTEHESTDALSDGTTDGIVEVDYDLDGWDDGYNDDGALVDGIVAPLVDHPVFDGHFILFPMDAYVTDLDVMEEDWPLVIVATNDDTVQIPVDDTYYYCSDNSQGWCHPYDEYVAVDTHDVPSGPALLWLESGREPGVNALDINMAQSVLDDPLYWNTPDGGKACGIWDALGVNAKTPGACDSIIDKRAN